MRKTRFETASGESVQVPVDEIYNYLLSGAEGGSSSGGRIAIEVCLKSFEKGVLGSTALRESPFYTSYWFINSCIENEDPESLAAHFIHEWLHVIGFYHFPGNSARNDVAYNVGNAVKKLLQDEQASNSHSKSRTQSAVGEGGLGSEFLNESGVIDCGQCGKAPEELSAAEEQALKR